MGRKNHHHQRFGENQKGIDKLLEMLLLEAELLELKANPNRKAEGTVIEAKVTKGRGTVATVLIQKGTLRLGDPMVCGVACGKVRAMHNDLGKTLKDAPPSCPVEILGLEGVPEAGDKFFVVEDERTARKIAEERQQKNKERVVKGQVARHVKLEDLYSKIKDQNIKELKLIIKSDVQGSAEALKQSLEKISSEKIQLRVIHAAVGGINESDVMLAAASDAIVIGFNVRIDTGAQKAQDAEGVDVRLYNIIYEAIEDVKAAMEGMLEPTIKEVVVGKAKVLQVFSSSKAGQVAGCRVIRGTVARSCRIRVIRDNIVVFDGKLASLRRFKDDVREVQEGVECGLSLEGSEDIKENDLLESYKQEKVATKL
jgi:translation initiation factor IF-2